VTKKPTKRQTKKRSDSDAVVEAAEQDVVDAEVVEPQTEELVSESVEESSLEVDETPTETAVTEVVAEPAKGASPLWMLLGGLVAGGIGYGVATFQGGFDDGDLTGQLASQAKTISDLQEQIAALPAPTDISGLQSELATLATTANDGMSRLDTDVAAIAERLDVVEKQPSADGTLQEAAVAAYQRDIDALRAQIEAQQAEMAEMMAATSAQLTQTRDEAVAIEENAIAKARAATARVALAEVETALGSGAPFGDALTDLTEALQIEAPTALLDAVDGAPTLGQLQSDFPAAARNAISAARSEGADGEGAGGITSFLRNQFDVRSVTPQEGNSADAILSRAEAALKEGRLADTMAEIAGLPEVSRAALVDWSAMAETRLSAQQAIADLSSEIDVN